MDAAAAVSANASQGFTSMLASSTKIAGVNLPQHLEDLVDVVANASVWQILLTIFLMCVLYDQCTFEAPHPSPRPRA
jgi:hypothetical protein